MFRWFTLLIVCAATHAPITIASDQSTLTELVERGNVMEISAALQAGNFTSRALTKHYLDRIDRYDEEYRAILAINPNAVNDAIKTDEMRSQGSRAPLLGIPVLITDNIETRELPTTAGVLALMGNRRNRDAPLIAQLRKAGAIILGKTNLSEWANFRSERSSSGWSTVGGQTRNPYDPLRTPCGSSSGSGAAIAARFAPLAIGTETNGSIVCPSHVQGLVGFKPTVGLVSQTHIVPISASQDTAGPMALDVDSASQLFMAISDQSTLGEPLSRSKPTQPAQLRLGIVRSATGYHERVDETFNTAIDQLSDHGVTLVDELTLKPSYDGFYDDTYLVLLWEFKEGLNAYLSTLPAPMPVDSLESLIAFNRQHAGEALRYFPQDIFERAASLTPIDAPRYLAARQRVQQETRTAIRSLIQEHRLHGLIAPSGGPAWSIDRITGDRFLGGFSTYAAVAGFPHLTLPMGSVFHLPVGLSIIAEANADQRVLATGRAIEQILRVRLRATLIDPAPNS